MAAKPKTDWRLHYELAETENAGLRRALRWCASHLDNDERMQLDSMIKRAELGLGIVAVDGAGSGIVPKRLEEVDQRQQRFPF